MINRIIRFSILFVIIILVQVLILNNIRFNGYINPYVYLLFILLLPVEIPSWLLLLISFGTGLVMDFLSGSPGMHSSATVLAGFARPYVLRVVSPRDGYEPGVDPSLAIYGLRWFLVYASIIVVIHHTALFYLEVFRFAAFFRTLLRVLLSSLFSVTFILLLEYIRKDK
jgi:rod shape-determining protein MreD